jgi:hypothetical protein
MYAIGFFLGSDLEVILTFYERIKLCKKAQRNKINI